MSIIKFNKTLSFRTLLLICLGLIYCNVILFESKYNLIISIPQIIIIAYFIATSNLKKAIIWHFVFLFTSISATTAISNNIIYNYSRLKAVSNISISQIITLILSILSLKSRPQVKFPMFKKLRNLILFLFILGASIGILGIAIFNYNINVYINKCIYMSMLFLYIFILEKNATIDFAKECTIVILALFISAPVITFLSFYTGYFSLYGNIRIAIVSDLDFYVPILLLGLLYTKKTIYFIIPLILYTYNLLNTGRGGMFLIFSIAIIIFIYLIYINKRYKSTISWWRKIFHGLIPIIIISGILIGVFQFQGIGGIKFNQFISLFSFINSSSIDIYLESVGSSPYIRVSEILNITAEYKNNLLYGLLGKGYGGFFHDNMQLFSNLDSNGGGAYSKESIVSGMFFTAHSAFPNLLLYNGFIGLTYTFLIGIKYLKRINRSFLSFAVFPFLFYSLYYNSIIGAIAIFTLFASEIDYKKYKIDDYL